MLDLAVRIAFERLLLGDGIDAGGQRGRRRHPADLDAERRRRLELDAVVNLAHSAVEIAFSGGGLHRLGRSEKEAEFVVLRGRRQGQKGGKRQQNGGLFHGGNYTHLSHRKRLLPKYNCVVLQTLALLGRETARIVLPAACVVGDRELPWRDRKASCCGACWSALPRIAGAKCDSCAMPWSAGGEGFRCISCLDDCLPVGWTEAWGHYRGS